MLLRRSFRSPPRAEARSPFAPLGAPLALSWVLLAYAAVAVVAGCAFAALRIHDDYLEVMQEERVGLRGAAAALTSATQAMLYDGVGAALAVAGEIRAEGGLDRLSHQALALALQRQLTGGSYVRSLFLEDAGRFVLASRARVIAGTSAPGYLPLAVHAAEVWVGAPVRDPENPTRWVVPIARRAQTAPTSSGWAGALISFSSLEQLNGRFGNVVSEQGLVQFDESEQVVREVLAAGAHGYVLKSDAGRILMAALDTLLEGGSFFTPKVGKMVVDGYLRNPSAPAEPGAGTLSAREREIVQLLAEGKSNKEVATALGISVKTAETHRGNIMRKCGFGSLAELVRYAIRNHIIEP